MKTITTEPAVATDVMGNRSKLAEVRIDNHALERLANDTVEMSLDHER